MRDSMGVETQCYGSEVAMARPTPAVSGCQVLSIRDTNIGLEKEQKDIRVPEHIDLGTQSPGSGEAASHGQTRSCCVPPAEGGSES